jgi:hypothetical protein
MPNSAPIGPINNIKAATGPLNPVVWTLIFHLVVNTKTTPVLIE